MAISPDGQTLATGGQTSDVTLWGMLDGQSKTLTGLNGWVNAIAFSPDGKMLATGENWKELPNSYFGT